MSELSLATSILIILNMLVRVDDFNHLFFGIILKRVVTTSKWMKVSLERKIFLRRESLSEVFLILIFVQAQQLSDIDRLSTSLFEALTFKVCNERLVFFFIDGHVFIWTFSSLMLSHFHSLGYL